MAEILVLDIAASKTGALSILRDFYDHVREHAVTDAGGKPVNRWTFVTGVKDILQPVPERCIEVLLREDVKASQAARLRFELVTGGKWINGFAPDVVFSLENMIPRGVDGAVRKVLYIHQPVGFQKIKRFSLFKSGEREQALYQRFYHRLIIASAKRADSCVVQTEWMKRALLDETGLDADRVHKIPPEIPDASQYMKKGVFESGRFFFPASRLPYKNHAVIERARTLLEERGYVPEILYTTDRILPREEIFAEYSRSTLVFPSYIETFGMPLAEAMQSGNPIIAADTEFSREILAGYGSAYFFDPFDETELAGLMQQVMDGSITPGEPCYDRAGADTYSKLVDIILK